MHSLAHLPPKLQDILARPFWSIEQVMARTPATFKKADVVRAVKAVRAAGLDVKETHITPDGLIRLIHIESGPHSTSDYDRFEAEL